MVLGPYFTDVRLSTVECSGGYSKIEFDESGCVRCVGEGKFQKLDQASF